MADTPAGNAAAPHWGVLAGIELGGTKCICILANGPDDVLATHSLPTGSPQGTLAEIGRTLSGWSRNHAITALGIASFGPLDLDPGSPRFGSLTTTPKPGWAGVDLTGIAGSIPCTIDTDVNGAALAEGRWGAARGLRSWCYVTLGTGVGVASIVQGEPVMGIGHSEAGHMRVPLPDEAFRGTCPFHGNCVEGLISGPALAARSAMAAADIPDDHPVWDEAAATLAHLCHNLLLTVVPEAIVIGGGVAQRRPFLIDRARSRLVESLSGYASGAIVARDGATFLVPAKLGAMAGPLGAIALADRCAA